MKRDISVVGIDCVFRSKVATDSGRNWFMAGFDDTGWEPPGHRPLDAGDGAATDSHLASPAMPQHKNARRHNSPHHTALELRSRGFSVGLRLPLLWRQHEAAAQEIEVRPAKHLALQHLQTVDVPFHGAATPA